MQKNRTETIDTNYNTDMNYQNTKPLEILVTGATGNHGGAVAQRLLKQGFRVRALARDPSKAEAQALADDGATLVEGDLEDRDSIDRAMDGVYGVFAVLPFYTENWDREVEQGTRLADAAQAAGVEHYIYGSGARANERTGVPHLDAKGEIERYLRTTDLDCTVFRPAAFNYSLAAYREGVMDGVLPDPRDPDSLVYQIDENDYATLVALAFLNPTQWIGQQLNVADEVLTVQEMADMFGRVVGHDVEHMQISWDEEREMANEEVVRLAQWVDDSGPRIDVETLRATYPWFSNLEHYLRTHGWEDAAKGQEEEPTP